MSLPAASKEYWDIQLDHFDCYPDESATPNVVLNTYYRIKTNRGVLVYVGSSTSMAQDADPSSVLASDLVSLNATLVGQGYTQTAPPV